MSMIASHLVMTKPFMLAASSLPAAANAVQGRRFRAR